MSTFVDSFDDSVVTEVDSTSDFDNINHHDDSGYVGYNAQQFDTFVGNDDVFESQPVPIYGAAGEFTGEENGKGFDGEFGGSDGPILQPPSEMAEEGFALTEWRRENAIRLEEKEKREKELLSKIIEEAEEYKVEFYKKREITCGSNKATNREKEKVRLDFAHSRLIFVP